MYFANDQETALRKSAAVYNYVISHIPSKKVSASTKNKLYLALCDIALEHHGSIIILAKDKLHTGSAFALLRPLIETVNRSFWVRHCATDEQAIELAQNKTQFPGISKVQEQVRDHYADLGGSSLFSLSPKQLRELHGFTHSGMEQIRHRFDSEREVIPHYPEEKVVALLKQATLFLVMSAVGRNEVLEGYLPGDRVPDSVHDLVVYYKGLQGMIRSNNAS